jgi:tRNA(adenine34) deaminase
MHFVDEGPIDSENLYLCLHPIPGWSFCYRHLIADWLGQGVRVLAPDLIGFGKSDKPKRDDAHSLDFHGRYLLEWLQQMDLKNVTLVVPHVDHPLTQRIMAQADDRIRCLRLHGITTFQADASEDIALQAPYPDAGHRAAERAFLSRRMR